MPTARVLGLQAIHFLHVTLLSPPSAVLVEWTRECSGPEHGIELYGMNIRSSDGNCASCQSGQLS